MDKEQIEKWRIEIPLPSKPPPYRPGDGPPLAPLRILPEHDTDAFIVDKRVLPGTAPNGELKLYMYYIVGWPDLPAARVSILATDIYNYVSPRAVEDFEYKALLERDEEEERREAEEKRKMELIAKKKLATSTSAASSNLASPIPGQKRRGRPSKAELQSRQLAQQSSFNISQSIKTALPPANTSGPSLSTPQKKLAEEIATDLEEDVDEADPEDAIYRQLCGYNDDPFEDMDIDDDRRDGDIPLDNLPETMSSGSEFRSYARTLWVNKDSTLFKRTNGSLALKSSTSHVPVPEVLRSNTQPPLQSSPQRIESRPRITPVPIPLQYNMHRSVTAPQLPNSKYSTTPIPVPTSLRANKEPQPKPPDAKHPITPVPVPSWPRIANKTDIKAPTSQDLTDSLQYRGFTPAGRSSGKWPSEQPHSGDISSQTSPLTTQQIRSTNHKESSQRRKSHNPKSTPEKKDEQAQVWVVERLEGDRVMNVGGKHVHYFKVRWAGDWPPDQNPTWEPEENITPALVKAYMKKKAARHPKTKSPNNSNNSNVSRTILPLYPPTLKRKYSSVAEAFAGEDDELSGVGSSPGENKKPYTMNQEEDYHNDDSEDEEEEEMLVVAADQEMGHSRKGPRLRRKPEDLGAVFMRDLAAAIRLGDEKRGSH